MHLSDTSAARSGGLASAVHVKQRAILRLERERLAADLHVRWGGAVVLVVLFCQKFAEDIHTEGARDANHAVRDLRPQVHLLLVGGVVDVSRQPADLLLRAVQSAWDSGKGHTECHFGRKESSLFKTTTIQKIGRASCRERV